MNPGKNQTDRTRSLVIEISTGLFVMLPPFSSILKTLFEGINDGGVRNAVPSNCKRGPADEDAETSQTGRPAGSRGTDVRARYAVRLTSDPGSDRAHPPLQSGLRILQ